MRANNDSSSSTLATDAGSKKKSLNDIQNNVGVLLKTLKPGDITNYPKRGERCTIHYDAYIEEDYISGENPVPFDSSRKRDGECFNFFLGAAQVIEGLDVAVSKMSLGEEVEVTIPFPYAYGVAGYPPVVPPRTTLIFRVELIQISSSTD